MQWKAITIPWSVTMITITVHRGILHLHCLTRWRHFYILELRNRSHCLAGNMTGILSFPVLSLTASAAEEKYDWQSLKSIDWFSDYIQNLLHLTNKVNSNNSHHLSHLFEMMATFVSSTESVTVKKRDIENAFEVGSLLFTSDKHRNSKCIILRMPIHKCLEIVAEAKYVNILAWLWPIHHYLKW